jgi:hypothetical protein
VSGLRLCGVIAIVIGLTLAGAGSAAASSSRAGDRAATRAYLAAATRLTEAAIVGHRRTRGALDAFVGHVAATCPGALAMAPAAGSAAQVRAGELLEGEATEEAALAQLRSYAGPLLSFAAAVSRLRWTDGALGRRVAGAMRRYRAVLALQAPDLCGEIAASAATVFQTVPPQTTAFVNAVEAAMSAPTLLGLLDRMRSYVTPAERGAVKRLRGLIKREGQLLDGALNAALQRLYASLSGR